MIAIKVNDRFLELDDKTMASFTMVNPIFDTDSTRRIFTYPFKIKLSALNKSIFKHANRLDVVSKTNEYPAKLYLVGHLFEIGVLQVGKITNNLIETVFKNRERKNLENLEEVKINEILETVNIPQPVQAAWIFQVQPPPNEYKIVINGIPFVVNEDSDINEAGGQLALLINNEFPGSASYVSGGQLTIRDEGYNPFVINFTTIQALTLTSATNFGQARQQNIRQYVDGLRLLPSDSHGFPTVQNAGLYGTSNSVFKGFVNYYHDEIYIENSFSLNKEWEHTYIPFVRLAYVIKKALAAIGISLIEGDWWNDTDTSKLLIYNNRTLDELFFELDDSVSLLRWINAFKADFSLNNHVPEMSAKELLSIITESFSLFTVLNDSTFSFRKKVEPLRKTPIDWTKKADPAYENQPTVQEGFTLKYAQDPDDTISEPQTYEVGQGKTGLEFQFGIPNEVLGADPIHPDTPVWRIVRVFQKGTNDLELGKNDYSFRLLFDRGVQSDQEGNDYWMSGVSDIDPDGEVIGTTSLTLAGEQGTFNTYHDGYIQLLQKPTVTKVLELDIHELLEIKKWENCRRRVWHNEGMLNGVIKTVQFKASLKGLHLSKVEFIKE